MPSDTTDSDETLIPFPLYPASPFHIPILYAEQYVFSALQLCKPQTTLLVYLFRFSIIFYPFHFSIVDVISSIFNVLKAFGTAMSEIHGAFGTAMSEIHGGLYQRLLGSRRWRQRCWKIVLCGAVSMEWVELKRRTCGCSIILVGDLDQLPPVKDIPLYAGTSHRSALWNTFNTVITLDTIFRQQGDNIAQVTFRNILQNIRDANESNILQNIRDANPTIDDYNVLMSRTDSFLSEEEICSFHDSMHLFPTNAQTMVHKNQMMKSLNTPIARSIAEDGNTYSNTSSKDEQLERIVLLCNAEKVMLTSNLLVSAGLVNGSRKEIVTIFYKGSTAPPQIPTFVVVDFPKYIGPPWDERNPTHLPIPAVKRNGRAQIPLKMAWALTIHKSQGHMDSEIAYLSNSK